MWSKQFKSVTPLRALLSSRHVNQQYCFTTLYALLLAIVLTVAFLWPLLWRLKTHLPSHQDGVFVAWTIDWISKALLTGQNVFNTPAFYPFSNTLAYSQLSLATAVFNLPLRFITHNIVLMSNTHLVVGTVLIFISMFLLAHHVTKSRLSASMAAVIFTFSSYHFQYLVHLQAYLIAGLPIAMLSFLKWLETSRQRYVVTMSLAIVYQLLNDPMTVFFVASALIPFLLLTPVRMKLKKNKRTVMVIILFLCLVTVITYVPYLLVSTEFDYTRSIREAAHFALSLDSFISFESGLLLITGLLLMITRKKSLQPFARYTSIWLYVLILVTGLLLSLGPALKVDGETVKLMGWPIPLPYALAYYLIPGFKAFRASSRWITLCNFGISLLLAELLLKSQLRSGIKLSLIVCITVTLWLIQVPSLPLFAIPTQVPPIYTLLKEQPQSVVAELPAYVWGLQPHVTEESNRLLYQSFHHKKLYNGASGFTPPIREKEWPWVTTHFPDSSVLHILRNQGINLIIVHQREFQLLESEKITMDGQIILPFPDLEQQIKEQTQLRLIGCREQDCLYQLQ